MLNKILDTKDSSVLLMNDITADFFSDYKDEFNFIMNHLNVYNSIPDKETFLSNFPSFDLIVVNEPFDYLVDELYNDRNKRMLAGIFSKVRTLLMEDKTEEAMDVYANSVSKTAQAHHLNTIDLLKDTSRFDAYVDRCSEFTKFYVSTGFKELDSIIGGWDRQEELATIVARPNVGKSWILLKCAVSALEQGLRVGVYSGEMSDRKVGYRIDTLISHISNSGLTKGNVDLQDSYKRYIDSLANKYNTCFKVLTPSMIGGPAGVNTLRAFIEHDNLDILFIDQHSLLADDRRAKNPIEKAANISMDLKNLQVLKKIPIIAVSQQNRLSTENVEVSVNNISQSDRIGQDSTIVIFLEQKDSQLKVKLVKSRDSENNKTLSYVADFNRGIFQYIPEENNALNGEGADELRKEFDEDDEENYF